MQTYTDSEKNRPDQAVHSRPGLSHEPSSTGRGSHHSLKKWVKRIIHSGVILVSIAGALLLFFPSLLSLSNDAVTISGRAFHVAPTIPLAIASIFFLGGAILTVWATERMLSGLVGLAAGLRVSAFIITAVLSGFEVENVAVGLAAGSRGTAPVALGSVFGGTIFLVCVAMGVAALFFPLKIHLPRGVLLVFAATPLLAGLGLVAPVTPRWAGVILLIAFALTLAYLIRVSRHKEFLGSHELEKAQRKVLPLWQAAIMTAVGIAVIGVGGEYVARGAQGIITFVGVPPLLMGMVFTPAVVSLEEIIRQAIPSKRGRHDVGAGNLIGTQLYFLLFNFGLIALATPVGVDPLVRQLDWPFLVLVTFLLTAFLWRGQVGRRAALLLLLAYGGYAALHLLLH